MDKGSDIRLRALAAMALRGSQERLASLASHLSDEEGQALKGYADKLADQADGDVLRIEGALRQMLASDRLVNLDEIHPGWILELLRQESPRVVGIVLRWLPSRHVRHLLQHLPPMLRESIPPMMESFAVPAPVLEIIRRRFAACFLTAPACDAADELAFEKLHELKGAELALLVRELGIDLLALALIGMPRRALAAIYNRLDLKDARCLQRRVRELTGRASREVTVQARATVLEQDEKHVGPDRWLTELGLSALSGALGEGQEELKRLLLQQLDPTDGYFLKRLCEQRSGRSHAAIAVEMQRLVLEVASRLAAEGRIDARWDVFSSSARMEDVSLSESLSSPDVVEHTVTAQVLA